MGHSNQEDTCKPAKGKMPLCYLTEQKCTLYISKCPVHIKTILPEPCWSAPERTCQDWPHSQMAGPKGRSPNCPGLGSELCVYNELLDSIPWEWDSLKRNNWYRHRKLNYSIAFLMHVFKSMGCVRLTEWIGLEAVCCACCSFVTKQCLFAVLLSSLKGQWLLYHDGIIFKDFTGDY